MKEFTEEELRKLIKEFYWQGYKDAGTMLLKLAEGGTLDDVFPKEPD
jgi:hypothetical protein